MGKTVHLGIRNHANRSTLSYANKQQQSASFGDLFLHLADEFHRDASGSG